MLRFDLRVEKRLFRLQDERRGETYTPGAYRHFSIREPKKRKISAAPFRDRVVHHALVAHLEPVWERRFIHHSDACRVGKGTHRALNQCSAWVRRSPSVLQCDIARFFPTIGTTTPGCGSPLALAIRRKCAVLPASWRRGPRGERQPAPGRARPAK